MSNNKIDLFFVQDSNLISIPNDNPQTGLQTTILSLPISTTGQPIKLDSMCSVQMIVDNLSDPVSYAIRYFLFRDNIQLVQTLEVANLAAGVFGDIWVTPNFTWIDIPTKGTHTYEVKIEVTAYNINGIVGFSRVLNAIQLV